MDPQANKPPRAPETTGFFDKFNGLLAAPQIGGAEYALDEAKNDDGTSRDFGGYSAYNKGEWSIRLSAAEMRVLLFQTKRFLVSISWNSIYFQEAQVDWTGSRNLYTRISDATWDDGKVSFWIERFPHEVSGSQMWPVEKQADRVGYGGFPFNIYFQQPGRLAPWLFVDQAPSGGFDGQSAFNTFYPSSGSSSVISSWNAIDHEPPVSQGLVVSSLSVTNFTGSSSIDVNRWGAFSPSVSFTVYTANLLNEGIFKLGADATDWNNPATTRYPRPSQKVDYLSSSGGTLSSISWGPPYSETTQGPYDAIGLRQKNINYGPSFEGLASFYVETWDRSKPATYLPYLDLNFKLGPMHFGLLTSKKFLALAGMGFGDRKMWYSPSFMPHDLSATLSRDDLTTLILIPDGVNHSCPRIPATINFGSGEKAFDLICFDTAATSLESGDTTYQVSINGQMPVNTYGEFDFALEPPSGSRFRQKWFIDGLRVDITPEFYPVAT